MSNSEQSQSQSPDQGNTSGDLKSLNDFKTLSLNDMEKELSSKDYSKATENQLDLDQDTGDSETSDENSMDDNSDTADQTNEQSSEEDSSNDVEDSTDSDDSQSSADNQKKQKKESLEERFAKLEKQNKELQAEFTRRSQRLRELEKQLSENPTASKKEESQVSNKKDKSKLDQLREKDPEAADAFQSIIREEAERIVAERIKPVEEQVTLRTRQQNTVKFNQGVEEFLNSPMKELEKEIVDIINENPSEWQRTIWEKDNAFELLKKELFYRYPEKVAKHILKTEKSDNASSTKKDRLKASQVGTKTKVSQPSKDVMSSEEFKKLSLAEMEKRLPKIRN